MPVYKDKERDSYYYSFMYKGKRVRSKRYKNKRDCEKALSMALLEVDAVATDTYTFSQVAMVYLAEKHSRLKKQSFDRLNTMLGHFLVTIGNVRVDRLTVHQYQDALRYIDNYSFNGRKLKNSYKNKIIRTFKQLCTFANRRFDLYTNVPDKFDPYRNEDKEEMKFITLDQFNALLEVVDEEPYRSMFIVLFYMGLRCGEMNALRWCDIDFDSRTLTVRHTVSTKFKDDRGEFILTSPKTKSSLRTLPMPRIVFKTLLDLRDIQYSFKEKGDLAYVFGGYRPIAESTIQKIKDKYLKLANLPIIRIHDFRHSCASYLINKGATPLLVSRWLGHSNVSMTLDVYSHLWSSELNTLVDLIDADNL